MERIIYLLALNKISKIGPVLSKNLIAYCGGVEQIFSSSLKELKSIPGIGPKVASNIKQSNLLEEAQAELELCHKQNIRIVSYLDTDYPQRLIHYKDSPTVIYCKGDMELNAHRTAAIVGTRNMSAYGQQQTERIIQELKNYNVQIISGMAYGVDITAHRTCVQLDIPTIAVLGSGLDRLYPATHNHVARKMLKHGGLISEFSLGTGPDREHFPMRNRIIASMSDTIIVIESKKKGGSMITADLAFHYNKDVFAIPGRVGDDKSEGCNLLIKWNKAALIQSGDDIARAMMWDKQQEQQTIQRQLFVSLSDIEKSIVDIIKEKGSINVDELSHTLDKKGSQLAGTLLQMELNGIIKSLPGNKIILV